MAAQTQTYVPPKPITWGPQAQPQPTVPLALPDPGAAPRTPGVVGPTLGPMPTQPGYTAPAAPTFSGTAPTATPYGAPPTATPYGSFRAPDPSAMASDPYYQFRLAQGNKARQASAAAHGTLLSGGFQKAMAEYNQGLASEEGDKIYGRALDTYNENRDTNAQNFGQSMAGYTAGRDTNAQNFGQSLGSFNARLGAFNANADVGLSYGNLARGASNDAYGRARDAYGDARSSAEAQAGVTNLNAQNEHNDQLAEYARQAALQRQRALAAAGRF